MDPARLQRDVERWLTHENYRFSHRENDRNVFTVQIRHAGSFGHQIEVFQPVQQSVALVVGSMVPLRNNQHTRYLRLVELRRGRFEKNVADYCRSIGAIGRVMHESGRIIVGVYGVIDDEERFNQQDLTDTLTRVAEMGDMVARFLIRVL